MAGQNTEGLNAVREFLKTNPRATPDEIREVADKYNFPLTFSGTDEYEYEEANEVER